MLNLITVQKPVNNLFKKLLLAQAVLVYSFLSTCFYFIAPRKVFFKNGFLGYEQINSPTTNYHTN